MKQAVTNGHRKSTDKPVTITTNTKFAPQISRRTIRKKSKANLKQPSKFGCGLDRCGNLCLYIFLVISFLIGAGGIAVCGAYYSASTTTTGWKIGGIVLGAITCIVSVILILLTRSKNATNRPWRDKDGETLLNTNENKSDVSSEQMNIDDLDDEEVRNEIIDYVNQREKRNSLFQTTHSLNDNKHEMASSPIPNSSYDPLKTLKDDLVFCPGCNRSHPSSHQCMYSTRTANTVPTPFQPVSNTYDSIAIQTEENSKKKKKNKPHTTIDRSLKLSTTMETQTDLSANVKDSIILRRVPIPTSKVIVQQPTTKVIIVRVPNVAGQLVIQPRGMPTDDKH